MPRSFRLAATLEFALELVGSLTGWAVLPLGGSSISQVALLLGTAFIAEEVSEIFKQ